MWIDSFIRTTALTAAGAGLLFGCVTANAGEKVVLNSGQTIEIHDDHTWSAVSESQRSADNDGAVMDLLDVKTDLASLEGREITTQGHGIQAADLMLLGESATDMGMITVKIDDLPRQQRRQLISQCGQPGCNIRLTGTVVKPFPGMRGEIHASSVTLR